MVNPVIVHAGRLAVRAAAAEAADVAWTRERQRQTDDLIEELSEQTGLTTGDIPLKPSHRRLLGL